MNRQTLLLVVLGGIAAGLLVLLAYGVFFETITKTDYHPPPRVEDELTDDRLEDRKPAFDPARVDRRPEGEWLINQSAAVIKLDVKAAEPDQDAALLELHPSYADAVAVGKKRGAVLPSVNLLDGKAKQFDDGLYAALDQAYYQGLEGKLRGHVALVEAIQRKLPEGSAPAAFLAAALELAGAPPGKLPAAGEQYLRKFRANEVASKPAGFYTWNETLSACFQFLRFLQREFSAVELDVPLAIAAVLASDEQLLADYRRTIDFYNHLTNPRMALSVADVAALQPNDGEGFVRLCKEKGVSRQTVAFLPPGSSRETVLFDKLFPMGLPPSANLMNELIRRIRSGEVDLKPTGDSGWYDYQVHALETLLLPEKGDESERLLLTKAYKKRMLEAFQALMTKRRETHLRDLAYTVGTTAAPRRELEQVRPRLRVEPCPSYYLRTARAYAFLANFLEAALGKDTLQSLHGLKQDGRREQNLYAELQSQRDLFYGLYLVSADDIGLKPSFLENESVDSERCHQQALDWLPKAFDDADLAADTRVVVPVYVDPGREATRVWATFGVRLAQLEASYARPPHLKPAKQEGDWQPAKDHQLATAHYLIPVDDFAEVELPGVRSLTRDEFRAVCDREKTKDAIVASLQERGAEKSYPLWLLSAGAVGAGVVLGLLFFVGKRVAARG